MEHDINGVKTHFNRSPYTKDRFETHSHSSENLVPFINKLNPKFCIDIGCGQNNFKGLIPNVIGIDVADYPEADINMGIEEVHELGIFGHNSADVVMALGSLNFGTWDLIVKQFGLAIDWVKPGGVFIVRVRLREDQMFKRGFVQHNWSMDDVTTMHDIYKDRVEYLIEPEIETAAGGGIGDGHGKPDFSRPEIHLAVWTWRKI